MTKLGIFVGEEKWTFFHEIFEDLSAHYQTTVYQNKRYDVPLFNERFNRWAFQYSLHTMLRTNDVCFFEWASELLVHASHMPKQCALVTRLHSFELFEWAPKINWNALDKIILVSEAMQDMFIEQYPAHAHKTEVVYNGRSLDRFTPPEDRAFCFNIGMLCNIKPIKRVYEAVLMFYYLCEQGYDCHFYIAGKPTGDGRYAVAVYKLVERLGLQDRVIFDGYVTDTSSWLQKIDIFISNSYWEGQQVALLEAMAVGCFCLSHWWAGAEEMLPAENLYITEAELRHKIVNYAEMSNGEKERHQAQLRVSACEKFNIARTKAQIRQLIDELVKTDTNNFLVDKNIHYDDRVSKRVA